MPDFVKKQLIFLAPRVLVCGILTFTVSGLVWKWNLPFALGIIFGIICILLNFAVMGYISYRATFRSASSAKIIMRISYFIRIIALGACLYLCSVIPWLNPIAFFITPFFINIVYISQSIIETIKERKLSKHN
jgi:hypothetical protein